MVGEPLISDSRIGQIENRVRQEVPQLPDAARFVSYVQEPTQAEVNGVEFPVNERVAVLAIVMPDVRHDGRERWVRGSRWLKHFRHFEAQHERIVGSPDVVYDDFLAVARRAAQMNADALALETPRV